MPDDVAELFEMAHEAARQSAAHAIRATLNGITDATLAAMIDGIRRTIYDPDGKHAAPLKNRQLVNHILGEAVDRLRKAK